MGAQHGLLRHRLAEGYGGRLDDAAAAPARLNAPVLLELTLQIAEFIAYAAGQAGGVTGVAMQLNDLLLGHPGILVQIVHVLRDYRQAAAFLD